VTGLLQSCVWNLQAQKQLKLTAFFLPRSKIFGIKQLKA
jgi:hypothetical protein